MDYHKVLGVSKDADVAGIEKAFKLLALKHHPDKANAANAPKDRTETDEERKAREKRNNDRYVKLVQARDKLVELLNNPEGEGEQSGRQWPPGDYANYRHDGHHGGESSFRGHAYGHGWDYDHDHHHHHPHHSREPPFPHGGPPRGPGPRPPFYPPPPPHRYPPPHSPSSYYPPPHSPSSYYPPPPHSPSSHYPPPPPRGSFPHDTYSSRSRPPPPSNDAHPSRTRSGRPSPPRRSSPPPPRCPSPPRRRSPSRRRRPSSPAAANESRRRHAPPTAGSTRLAGSAREAVETLEKAERALNALDGELMELRETVRRARSQRRDGSTSTSTSTSTSSSSSSSLQYDYEAVMRLFDDALRRSDGWKGKTHCAIQHLKHTPRPSGGGDGGDGLLPLERDALRAARAHRMLLGDLVGDLGAALARPRPDHYRDLLGKIRRAFDRFRP